MIAVAETVAVALISAIALVAVALVPIYIEVMRARRRVDTVGEQVQQVHVLVNSRLDAAIARSDELVEIIGQLREHISVSPGPSLSAADEATIDHALLDPTKAPVLTVDVPTLLVPHKPDPEATP